MSDRDRELVEILTRIVNVIEEWEEERQRTPWNRFKRWWNRR
jgi:hypothetical protein